MQEHMYIPIFILTLALLFNSIESANCTRDRCCALTTCTSLYCQERNTETWISTESFDKYQYTKLVLSNNMCRPCAYNCKSCLSPSTCTTCYDGFNLLTGSGSQVCQPCPYNCLKCLTANSISKCLQCNDGTYLDSNTQTCRTCPTGAKTCLDSTTISECLSGYLKSSNSLFCSPCASNCLTCPSSTSTCTSCATTYYIQSSQCVKCTISNCDSCYLFQSNVYCSACSSSYYRQTNTTCSSCTSSCKTCTSSTVCTVCKTGYYIQSGACLSITTTILNCDTYSATKSGSINLCSTCLTGYYVSDTGLQCLPCSVTCNSCYGDHFGKCTSCTSTSKLFNQMCLPYPHISQTSSQIFLTPASDSQTFSGGSLGCEELLYTGTNLVIPLNGLKSYKISVTLRLLGNTGGQAFNVAWESSSNNTKMEIESGQSTVAGLTIGSEGYQACTSSSVIYYHSTSTLVYLQPLSSTTLTISSSNQISIKEILITTFQCSSLCLECSETECYTCMTNNLYAQDFYCVYRCSSNYYTLETTKQCLKQCPAQTYPLTTNLTCQPCSSPCLTCLNPTYCLTCIESYYLSSLTNTCLEECPYKYFPSPITQKCESCTGRCEQCLEEEICTTCKIGFLHEGQCVDLCPEHMYADIELLQCQSCAAECRLCIYENSHCTACFTGMLYWNNTCVGSCIDGYYASSSECLACSYPCETCESSPTECLSCIDGYLFESTCVVSCASSYFEDNINLICEPCFIGCTECYASSTNCLSCSQSYHLFNNECVLECPEGYYNSIINNNISICSKCSSPCFSCTNETFCLSCLSNFLSDLNNGECVRSSMCSTSYYAEIETLKCETCSLSCFTCLYEQDVCTSCHTGSVLSENTCISACPSNYWYPQIDANGFAVCVTCESPCFTCIDSVTCLSCVQGYKYSSPTHTCSSTCSSGSFFDSLLSTCIECSSNCLTCTSTNQCQTCETSTYLHIISSTENECRTSCPSTYYPDTLACMKCLYPCLECSSSVDCKTCVAGVVYEGRCFSGCPHGTYSSGINNTICLECEGECLTCKDEATKCTLCQSGYYLIKELYECVSECPSSTFLFSITQSCQLCPSSCSTCVNSTHCTTCVSLTYLSPLTNLCTQACPSGYYGNNVNLKCEVCSQECETCQISSTNCLSCTLNYLLLRTSPTQVTCAESCPSGYYSASSTCIACVFPCKSCTSPTTCSTCILGTYLHSPSSTCLMNCPVGTYYANADNSECLMCAAPCKTCTNSTNCLSCINGYLLNGSCVNECPQYYYADGSGICNRCNGLCETCIGKYHCLTCQAGFAYSGYCYSTCPAGTYSSQTTKTCEPCESPCLECTSTPTFCKKCQNNLLSYLGSCSSTCPTGTYQSSSETCTQCPFPCTNCPSQLTCLSCVGGYLLYMNNSCIANVEKCPNDLYKMDSKYCVPLTWCPLEYYRDPESKTCSKTCNREKYIDNTNKECLDSCNTGQYVGVSMECVNWSASKPISLMAMRYIVFIQSSQVHIVILFNETHSWQESSESIFTLLSLETTQRLLSTSTSTTANTLEYTLYSANELILQLATLPYSAQLTLPAHYITSSSTNYNIQNTNLVIKLPELTVYTYQQLYLGKIMQQFSEGICWFIILVTLLFLVINRISDTYALWDTAQLLYLLIFLDIQYPPNLNDFLVGLKNIHFLFIPSIFANVAPADRLVSSPPFYAYAYDSSFIRTAGSPLLIVIVCIIIFIILKTIELVSTHSEKVKSLLDSHTKIKNFVYKGILRFRWHHTSDIFFLSYDIIVLFAVAEIYNLSQNPNNIGSNVFCIIVLVIYLAFPCFVSYKLYKHYPNISKGRMVTNLQCFYRGIEKNNKFGIALILTRYFRKLTYTLIIGIFTKEPMFALPILTFTSVLMGLFIFINKPYKKRLSNIVSVLTEAILVIVFIVIAIIEFGNDGISNDVKVGLGWICCGLLLIVLFVMIFEIFIKTMFYLEPEEKKERKLGDLEKGFTEEYIRQKAGEFFDRIFPKLRNNLNLSESSEEYEDQYQEGDSQNSENNEKREKNWGIESESDSKHSDEFRHYGGAESDDASTSKNDNKVPNYLIRCVKELR